MMSYVYIRKMLVFQITGGKVNNCTLGKKNVVDLSPSVFITGLMRAHSKLHVWSGPQTAAEEQDK